MALLAVVVLAGWLLPARSASSLLPGLPTEKANAAIAFLAAGISLICLRPGSPEWERRGGVALGILIAAFGMAVCAEYATGSIGFDQLVMHDSVAHLPGRPSSLVAVGMVGLGGALAIVDARRPPRWCHGALVALIASCTLLGLVGRISGLSYARGTADISGTAIPDLLCLTLATIGAIALRPGRGLGRYLAGGDPSSRFGRLAPALVAISPIVLAAGAIGLHRAGESAPHAALALCWMLIAGGVASTMIALTRYIGSVDATVARLAAVVESSHDAIIATTLQGIITSWNSAAERLYGYEAEAAVGRPISILFDAEALAGAPCMPDHTWNGEELHAVELPRRTRDGRTIYVDMTVSPVREQHGLVVGVSELSRDVTERTQATEALRKAQELVRSAFEHAPIGMVMLDLEGRFDEVNAVFCEILGRTPQQLLGAPVESFTHPDDVERDLADRQLLLGGTRALATLEKRYLTSAGETVQVATQATLLHGPDGIPARFLLQVQDITDRRRHERQLEYLADHDALTGLLNRPALACELESHATLVARYGPVGAVLVIDLDHVKFIDDTLGHQTGDELIVHAARLLAGRLRGSDVIARLGGDEFGVLLRSSTAADALEVAHDLLAALRDQEPQIGGPNRRITASIGVATFAAPRGMSGDDVLVNADLAMYDAKEEGRDRVCMFQGDDQEPARTKGRITWAYRIQEALQHDRFTLLAQPIVDLRTQLPTQYEMLLRMRDGGGDLLGPERFITIAERLGMMQQIDAWVISRALQLLAELDQQISPAPALEINLSGGSLGDPMLLAHIEREVQQTGIDPARLIFEVTETVALASINEARAFGERISHMGCRFALDDFGAGFGSFSYLKHLHYDLIKIDGEFVRNCTTSDVDQLLIASLVQIARRLGKHTIAECIGDDQTAELVAKLGVDYGQGFHLGSPESLTRYTCLDHRVADDAGNRSAANGDSGGDGGGVLVTQL